MIQRIDEALLARVQAIADRVHGWTGLDCLQQVRVWHVITVLAWLTGGLCWRVHGWESWSYWIICLAYVCFAFYGQPRDAEVRAAATRGFRNYRRVSSWHRFARLAGLFLCLQDALLTVWLGDWASLVWLISVVAGWWWECCDLLPPCSGKVREWLRSLAPARPVAVGSAA